MSRSTRSGKEFLPYGASTCGLGWVSSACNFLLGLRESFQAMEGQELRGEEDCEGLPLDCVAEDCGDDSDGDSTLSSAPQSTPAFSHPLEGREEGCSVKICAAPTSGPEDSLRATPVHATSSFSGPVSSANNESASEACTGKASRRKRRHNKRNKERGRVRHRRGSQHRNAANYTFSESMSRKYQAPIALQVDFTAEELAKANGAWVGLRGDAKQDPSTLAEAIAAGLKLVSWDGRTPLAILDRTGTLFAILAGRPGDEEDWDAVVSRANIALQRGQSMLSPSTKNRRGKGFTALACGISHGGGQRLPGNLRQTNEKSEVVEMLTSDEDIVRIVGFANSQFAFYAPKLYREYQETLDRLFGHHEDLDRIFPRTVWPAASFNLGDQVVCREHRDAGNLPNGWCAVFSLGDFDPKKGGHLILCELGLVVEFPPGSLVLIPSSTITHGNTCIQDGETRRSFALYAAGGLFRWVNYGFRRWEDFLAKDRIAALASKAESAERWVRAMSLYSRVDTLHDDRVACGLIS